jgi:hypothetical protein
MGEWERVVYNLLVIEYHERLYFTHTLSQYKSEKK